MDCHVPQATQLVGVKPHKLQASCDALPERQLGVYNEPVLPLYHPFEYADHLFCVVHEMALLSHVSSQRPAALLVLTPLFDPP